MEDMQAILRDITRRLECEAGGVHAFWLKVLSDRRAFAEELLRSRGTAPIVPLVVRGTLFQNANALLDDLAELVNQNRAEFEALLRTGAGVADRCAILLLAHNEFALPQVSSPAYFPEWFPVGGGRQLNIAIEDLTWKMEAPLDGTMLRIEELSTALVRLEIALLERIERVRAQNHNAVNAFFDLIRRDKEPFGDFLASARAEVATMRAGTFRPSAKEARSLTARIWVLVRTCTPDQLNRKAEALTGALALPEPPPRKPYESMLAVLARPTHEAIPANIRMARNLLASVFATCQLMTAVHHAGDYGEYPLTLMRSTGFDLLRAISSSEEAIKAC